MTSNRNARNHQHIRKTGDFGNLKTCGHKKISGELLKHSHDKSTNDFEKNKELGSNLTELSKIEKRTYEFIRQIGEVQPNNLPDKRMTGAIANLKNKGLVEVHKRYTSRFRRKKKKFAKIKTWSSREDELAPSESTHTRR